MVSANDKMNYYTKRLLMSRMRLLVKNGFYGLLLMHMKFAIDENCTTAASNGKKIYFGPEFLEDLSDSELDFIMMHEIMHVVLKHCFRGKEFDNELFNIACDIVVNSNILYSEGMKLDAITLKKYGESMHLAPNGKEGYNYTAEEVYYMLNPSGRKKSKPGSQSCMDDHSKWDDEAQDDSEDIDEWVTDALNSCSARSAGNLPMFAERLLKELKNPQTDWRLILDEFVQEEIVDYSFSPPDRRFEGSGFFLPDFNGKEDLVEDILFMVDTSGSMNDNMITAAFSEVKGAIDQFDGKLKGWLGFFDAAVIEPVAFETVEEFKAIRPKGGGGTNFGVIFKYVREHMADRLPASIIILTDGYAEFPPESAAMGIPVLWLLNNEVVTPEWGKIARITI